MLTRKNIYLFSTVLLSLFCSIETVEAAGAFNPKPIYKTVSKENLYLIPYVENLDEFPYPGQYFTYIEFQNLEPERYYTFAIRRPILDEKVPKELYTLKGKEFGKINRRRTDNELIMVVGEIGFFPGEEIECYLIPQNSNQRPFTFKITPNAYKVVDSASKLTAEITLDKLGPPQYKVTVHGLKLNDWIIMSGISSGQIQKQQMIEITKLPYEVTIKPGVAGDYTGDDLITISRDNGTGITLRLPWGPSLEKFLRGERKPLL